MNHQNPVQMMENLPTCSITDDPLSFSFFGVVFVAFAFQSLSIVALAIAVLRSCKKWLGGGYQPAQVSDPVAAVVPCFLPNEQSIIEDTIRHLMTRLSHVDNLDVYVVYNTPYDLPAIEAKLQKMTKENWPEGRRLFVQRVFGSTSKAENLNHVIPQIPEKDMCKGESTAKYTVIYDADHHPDPDSLALAIAHLEETDADCVQGSTYIREGAWLPRNIVCAEFFLTYFAMLPMMREISGTALFGGANGIWRTTSLNKLYFDHKALCEDIDCFARAFMNKSLKFEFLPEACSGELLPSSVSALWKQRLRWAMGWDQVTLKYIATFCEADLSLRKRVGLFYIFFCRWITQFTATMIIFVNSAMFLAHLLKNGFSAGGSSVLPPQYPCTALLQHLSGYLFAVLVAFGFVRALLHKPQPAFILGVTIYFLCVPLYLMFGTVLLVVSFKRLISGKTGSWVVTTRTGTGAAQEPLLKEPLLKLKDSDNGGFMDSRGGSRSTLAPSTSTGTMSRSDSDVWSQRSSEEAVEGGVSNKGCTHSSSAHQNWISVA